MRFRPARLACFCGLLLVCQNALAQKPQLSIQTGHANYVDAVALSRDGRTLASGGDDNSVRLWDVATGTELRTLAGHVKAVFAVAFSPDDKRLASGSGDDTIVLWELETGAHLRTLKSTAGHNASIHDLAFSPDGKTLFSAHADGQVRLWDVASGTERSTLKGHTEAVNSIALSNDGHTLASAGRDKTIRIWDVPTGKLLRTLAGHADVINEIALSADAKTLVSGGEDKTLKLWRVADGGEIRTLTREAGAVLSMALSPDDKLLATGGWEGMIAIWDMATGKRLHAFEVGPFNKSMVFSADSKTLVCGSGIKVIIIDVATGKAARTFDGRTHRLYTANFSPDGKSLTTRSASGDFKLWDTTTGSGLRTVAGDKRWLGINTNYLSADGKLLAKAERHGVVKIVDVASGKELRSLTGHTNQVVNAAFSPDAKRFASASSDETLRVWDVASGRELTKTENFSYLSGRFAFDARGEKLILTRSDNPFQILDVGSNKEFVFNVNYAGSVETLAVSGDGKIIASGSGQIFNKDTGGNVVKLYDAATGTELRTLAGHAAEVRSVAFSPDGKTLASGSDDSTVKLWDVATGNLLHTLAGHGDEVKAVAFSPDGYIVSSASQDTRLKLWEAATGRELASLIAVDERDWLVVTPDGLFDGSPAAWNRILWRFSPTLYDVAPVEQFFNEFYYPGLLTDICAGKRPRAAADISQKDRRQPEVKISTVNNVASDAEVAAPHVQIKVEVREAAADKNNKTGGSGAQDVRLFRNGTLVKLWRGDVLKGNAAAALEERIPIVAGENRFTAYAFNRDNVKSADAVLSVNGAESLKRPSKLYVLAVGVNVYANASFNLKYAVADAEEFGKEWERQQKLLGRYAETVVVPLLDAEATKANILLAIKRLVEVETTPTLPTGAPEQLGKLKYANPEDAVVVYFAGHGTAQAARFYLIPHDLGYAGKIDNVDAVGLETMLSHSISDRELEEAFERLNAGQLVMVLDACNSGQALEAEEKRRGPMNSKGLAQLAYEKGMYILTAAQSFQAAQEVSQLGHGLLTYALVEEGLKRGAADGAPNDGTVTVREWLDFATERVPEMQFAEMKRALARGLNLSFAGEEQGLSLERRNVQRPRVFYRRELEANTLLVAKTAPTPATEPKPATPQK